MTFSRLALIFLALFPGAVRAQAATRSCRAPRLLKGYIVPEGEQYRHDSFISYACDRGHKPAVEGWWATSQCQNGVWSPVPQCIEEEACFPLQIPNAEFKASSDAWFPSGRVLRIECEEGYKHKDFDATAVCENGSWSSVPVCERDIEACHQPPRIPHAVITNYVYKELFNRDSEVKYQCEDGYTLVPTNNKNSIFCISGNWTEGPTCRAGSGSGQDEATGDTAGTRPETGDGGTTVGGTGTRPSTGQGGTTGSTAGTRPDSGTTAGGAGTRPGAGDGGTTVSSAVRHCGGYPYVPNAEVVRETDTSLKYQCVSYHVLVTSFDTVVCQSNGRWTPLPVCKATFCLLDPGNYVDGRVPIREVVYFNDDERKLIRCNYNHYLYGYYYAIAHCNNGQVTWAQCCHPRDRRPQYCVY